MVAVVAAVRDGRRLSRLGPGLHPLCGPCTCWVRINEMKLSHAVCLAPTRRSAALHRESQGLRLLALPAQGPPKPPAPRPRPAPLAADSACGWGHGGTRERKRNKKVAIKPLLPALTVLHLDLCSPTHHWPSSL